MIQLWSVWNYTWFSLGSNHILPINNSLKSSIFITSLIGGYMVYVYPKKISIKFGKYKFKPSYFSLVIGDLLIHQYPLIYIINLKLLHNKNLIDDNSCGRFVLAPFTCWAAINTILKTNFDKIYGIKIKYLIASCGSILLLQSLTYHTNPWILNLKNR